MHSSHGMLQRDISRVLVAALLDLLGARDGRARTRGR